MSDTPSLPTHPPTINIPSLPQKIPITYLWFGKDVPEDYLISLAEVNYPVQFLKNPHFQTNFTREILDIEKSDYYRLQHLYEYGGIYSDLDNIIDYDCLMQLLKPYRNQDKLVFMSSARYSREKTNEMIDNLIFAPYAGMPILKKMLESVDEKQGRIWGFAGMVFLAKFDQPLQVNMDKCVQHTGDWSWVGASNQVLHQKRKPISRYAAKLVKKRDIMAQKQKLEQQLNNTKFLNNQISKQLTKVKDQNAKLKHQIDGSSTQTSKVLIGKLETQVQHKRNQNDHIVNQGNNRLESGNDLMLMQMQKQLEYLMEKNENLQAEKDVMTMVTGGAVMLVLVLVVIGVLLFRRKKKGSLNSAVQASNTMNQQQSMRMN